MKFNQRGRPFKTLTIPREGLGEGLEKAKNMLKTVKKGEGSKKKDIVCLKWTPPDQNLSVILLFNVLQYSNFCVKISTNVNQHLSNLFAMALPNLYVLQNNVYLWTGSLFCITISLDKITNPFKDILEMLKSTLQGFQMHIA